MKRLITPILLLACFVSFAQRGGKMMQEKIKAQKVAYITEQLSLTPTEAEKFWPIYNIFDETMHQLRRKDMRDLRERMRSENVSESDAKQIIEDYLAIEELEHQAEIKLLKDLSSVIPAKKIIKLKSAEDSFNRMLMKRLRERGQSDKMKRNFP